MSTLPAPGAMRDASPAPRRRVVCVDTTLESGGGAGGRKGGAHPCLAELSRPTNDQRCNDPLPVLPTLCGRRSPKPPHRTAPHRSSQPSARVQPPHTDTTYQPRLPVPTAGSHCLYSAPHPPHRVPVPNWLAQCGPSCSHGSDRGGCRSSSSKGHAPSHANPFIPWAVDPCRFGRHSSAPGNPAPGRCLRQASPRARALPSPHPTLARVVAHGSRHAGLPYSPARATPGPPRRALPSVRADRLFMQPLTCLAAGRRG